MVPTMKVTVKKERKTMTNPLPRNAAAPPSNGRSENVKSGRLRMRPQPWWLIFAIFLIANYGLTRVFFPGPFSISIPYTFFMKQVEAGNVEVVSSMGDSIEGSFKSAVTYPPQKVHVPINGQALPPSDQVKPATSMRFKRQRQRFADQDV